MGRGLHQSHLTDKEREVQTCHMDLEGPELSCRQSGLIRRALDHSV
jgi:hypothetical protein